MPKRKEIPFHEVIAALLDTSRPFPPTYLHRFSDLERAELRDLKNSWKAIEPTRRLALLNDLDEMANADTLVDFDQVALIALSDPQGNVRAQAAGMLGEYENDDLIPVLIEMVEKDPEMEARAAAAAALGKYIYLGEIEEISAELLHSVEECLLHAAQGEDDPLVQRKALESLGFSGRPEVPPLIRKAYDSRQPEWVASALFAMGRSYDQVWDADVKRELRSAHAAIQLEAVRAAGALSLDSTRRILLDLLTEEGTDSDIRSEVIWSLSEIGGEEVREALEDLLEETDDEEEAELIDEALDNLSLNEEIASMDLLDLDLEEEAKSGHIIDISQDMSEEDLDDLPDDTEAPDNGSAKKKSRPRHKKSS